MPYTPGDFDSTHLYLQWGGKLPGGDEWSCGMRLRGPAASAEADALTLIDDYAAAVEDYHTATGLISKFALLSFVKLNAIGVDGHYVADTTNEQVFADIPGNGSAAVHHPNQVALTVSLLTGFSRGPAHRGRFYLPLPYMMDLDANGKITTSWADSAKTHTAAFLAAVNAATPAWKAAVFSRKSGAATHRDITGVAIGLVLDTQRRRRNKLTEDYR